MAAKGVTWKFIPPSAPHFVGVWEAAVKSFKTHLKRTVGPGRLTYEELSTLLLSIEAVLNSRPLGPIVGEPVIAIPEANLDSELNVDLLHHWKLVQALRAVFWNRRGKEYLNTLQQRVKWRCRHENLSVGDCVVIVDPSFMTATGRWPLGRVTKVYLGQDGMVRVADVRTAPNDAPASTA
ncbi:hypothetical protein TKK_0017839 [Trichogramma kaykai]